MKKLIKHLFLSIFLGLFSFNVSNLQAAAQFFGPDGKPIEESANEPAPQPAPFVFGAVNPPMPLFNTGTQPQTATGGFAFQAPDSTSGFQFGSTGPVVFKPCESAKKLNLKESDLRDLIKIIELRAEAFFRAIFESNERQATADSISNGSSFGCFGERRTVTRKLTHAAVNDASNKYITSSMYAKRELRRIDIKCVRDKAFTYETLAKIIEDEVLSSEQIKLKKFESRNLDFQFGAIGKILDVSEKTKTREFLEYIKLLQDLYCTALSDIGGPCSKPLFLELLNLSERQIKRIYEVAIFIKIKRFIDSACAEKINVDSSTNRSSSKVSELKSKISMKISEERAALCNRLMGPESFTDILSSELKCYPSGIINKILELVAAPEIACLNHYISIWCKHLNIDPRNIFETYPFNSETKTEFKNILSCIDHQTGSNAKATLQTAGNVCKNMIEKLTQLGLGFFIKTEAAPIAVSVGNSKEKELEAQRMAEKLIREDVAEKKRLARKKAASPTQVSGKSKNGAKKNSVPEKTSVVPGKELQKQAFLPSSAVALIRELRPSQVATYEDEPDAQWITIESEKRKKHATQDLLVELEAANVSDQHLPKFNLIQDISRADEFCSYRCKIFLYPALSAIENNFLKNLDYTGLEKYKNKDDNNHAFSNLVEKAYGHLGHVDKVEILEDGWIKMYISFPGRLSWIGHSIEDGVNAGPNGVFEFIILKKNRNPNSYAFCVHRFFRPTR